MNSSTAAEESNPELGADRVADGLEEPWFDEPPPSTMRRPSSGPPPPLVRVGEFLGDPEVDAWLR